MKKLVALLTAIVLSTMPLLFTAGPAAAATCSGGWFNAQYPVGGGSVSAVASCQAGPVGYPYASHSSPSTSVCLQWFNSFDQWQTRACTTLTNNAPPTYVVAGLIHGSWRTLLTGGTGNRASAVVGL